jgi:ABC-2 type transport system permease protein
MLMKQHARTEWASTTLWSLLMGAFIFFTVYLWEMAVTQGFMADLAQLLNSMPAIRTVWGVSGDLATLPTWLQFFSFGGWMSLLLLVFVALFTVGIVTREMDRRTMEFLLSLPVARWQVILARWANLAVALLVLHLAQFVAVVVGVAVVGEQGTPGRYLAAEFNSFLLFLAIGSVMLAVSMLTDDYGWGVATTLAIGFALYFINTGTEHTTGLMKQIHDVLPFALYKTPEILLKGHVPWGDMAGLAAIALAGLGLSVWLFQRKQIAV